MQPVVQWRHLRWFLVVAAIVVRCLVVYTDGPLLGTDQGYQIGGARALLEGRGVTLDVFELPDISKVSTIPLSWWPPLFSLVAAPLLAVSDDPALVLALVTCAGIGLIFGAWFVILETLGPLVDWRAKLLIWLYWILVAPPVTLTARTGVTDYLALGLFSVALACALFALTRRSSARNWDIAAGCALGLGGALRHAYTPVAIVLPTSVIIIALLNRDRAYIRDAVRWTVLAGTIIAFGALLRLSGPTSPSQVIGSAREVSSVVTRLAPVPAVAFGLGRTWTPGAPGTTLLWTISAAILCLLLMVILAHCRRLLRSSMAERRSVVGLTFLYMGGLTGLWILVASFIYLSLKQHPSSSWLFVEETRYYAPVFGLIVSILFIGLFERPARNRIVAYTTAGLMTFIAAAVTSTESETWARRMRSEPRGVAMDSRDPGWKFYYEIKRRHDAGQKVWFLHSGGNNWYKAWASAAGAYIHHGVPQTSLVTPIKARRSATVVILLMRSSPQEERQALRRFIGRGATTLHEAVRDGEDLYVVESAPTASRDDE